MKDKTKLCLIFMVIIAIWICLLPLVILAEGETTYFIAPDECINYSSNNSVYRHIHGNVSEVRVVVIYKPSEGKYALEAVSEDVFTAQSLGDTNGCLLNYDVAAARVSYYEGNVLKYKYVYTMYYNTTVNGWNVPVFNQINGMSGDQTAIYYTFGAGAVNPEPVTNWGILKDVEYQTRIAGQGYASKRNVDYISWNPFTDANGNDISECDVEIQAVLGKFSGTTEEELLNKTLNDFNIGSYNSVSLGTTHVSNGNFSVSWQRVVDLAGWNFDSLYSHLENNIFLKQGWYYQIRLVTDDGYVGSWQTVYTPLSQSSKASETVLNQNSYDMNIYQTYEELTQINNQTSITVNFNGTEYIIQNPDDGEEPAEPYNYFDILKRILNGLIQIVGNIQKLPELFMESVKSLVSLPDTYDGSLAQRFDEEYNQYLEEKQPTIYDFLEGVDDVQSYITGFVPEEEGMHTCIIRWDDVTLNLSMFNAGTVTFIQHGEHNLTYTLYTLLQAFNMSYSDYQTLVSGIIYLWLLVFIWHHFIKFLEKD